MESKLISDSEWEIMRIVWNKAPVTSTVIIGEIEATKGWMPTTVKTFLARLVKKEIISYEKIGKSFFYSPLVTEEKCVRDELRAVIERVYGGVVYEQTDHFVFRGNPDTTFVKRLAQVLEDSYGKILTELEVTLEEPTQVYVHTTQRRLHSALGLMEGPQWLRAGHIWGLMHLAPEGCFDNIKAEQVAVHTFILLLMQKINSTMPYWLQQAVSTYYAGWMTKEKINAVYLDIQELPPMIKEYSMLSSYLAFKEVNGYEWGYTVIDFIVTVYGKQNLAAFLRNPSDFEGAFCVTEEEFWVGWRRFLEP